MPPKQEGATMAWLKMLKGERTDKTFPLNEEVTVLGSDATCEIVLGDNQVSKRHDRTTRKHDGFYIEVLQSTNGTRVANWTLTESPRLKDGDLIEIGSMKLLYSETALVDDR
jgi:pSer/pThr/pTyr-binding forkhead associated (FHA) protein